jgi:hypothetical protein
MSPYKLSLKKNLRRSKPNSNIEEDALLFTIIIIIKNGSKYKGWNK